VEAAIKKRLFVDCQVFQYITWNRGMGRYSLKLLEALDKEDIDLILIFNKNISIDNDRLKTIEKACPSSKKLYLRLSDDPNKAGGWNKLQNICANELDDQLCDVIQPEDTYLIASNFALRFCSVFPNLECRKALIFYDLTPYLHWSDYGKTPDFEPNKYFAQFETVFKADQLWSISQSAADEATDWLGIDSEKVQNIRGASIRNLNEKMQKPGTVKDEKFLLCPSADGPNKNNENMVRAFAAFNNAYKNKYKLVITSDFSNQSKTTLGSISSDLIFSGHVTDGELSWLYENCDALLFVSKTEGLGLPILEAVSAEKKVVCSNIKVFKEISEDAFYFANPNNIQSIADALTQALIVGQDWNVKKKQYPEISDKFSWNAAAATCLEMMDKSKISGANSADNDKLAFWYSDSDGSSLARDVAEILYPLNENSNFYSMRSSSYNHNSPSYLVEMGVATSALESNAKEELKPIYIIDDSEESAQLLLFAIRYPGLVVATFETVKSPENINNYLKNNFEGKINFKKFIKIVNLAGNHILHKTDFSPRGSGQFVKQVNSLSNQIREEEV
jgi:glycosyltransferase involved in cell wall biosynthesis